MLDLFGTHQPMDKVLAAHFISIDILQQVSIIIAISIINAPSGRVVEAILRVSWVASISKIAIAIKVDVDCNRLLNFIDPRRIIVLLRWQCLAPQIFRVEGVHAPGGADTHLPGAIAG